MMKSPYHAVAIASSAGGPRALKILLGSLPADFPIPIFIVQHLADGHAQDFATWLSKITSLKVIVASQDYQAHSGEVILAPDHFHLEITETNVCVLNDDPPIKELKPSACKLFASMAKAHGKKGIGIILSGMGNDGAEQLLLMKQAGALTFAQDENTSAMFGMPKEAIKLGAARDVVPIDEMGPLLTSHVMVSLE